MKIRQSPVYRKSEGSYKYIVSGFQASIVFEKFVGFNAVVDTNGVREKSDEGRHFSLHTPPDGQ